MAAAALPLGDINMIKLSSLPFKIGNGGFPDSAKFRVKISLPSLYMYPVEFIYYNLKIIYIVLSWMIFSLIL